MTLKNKGRIDEIIHNYIGDLADSCKSTGNRVDWMKLFVSDAVVGLAFFPFYIIFFWVIPVDKREGEIDDGSDSDEGSV